MVRVRPPSAVRMYQNRVLASLVNGRRLQTRVCLRPVPSPTSEG